MCCASAAQAFHEPGGRGVAPARAARGEPQQQVIAQRLAPFHTPLIEAVDAPQRAAGEHAVFVHGDERAERAGLNGFSISVVRARLPGRLVLGERQRVERLRGGRCGLLSSSAM